MRPELTPYQRRALLELAGKPAALLIAPAGSGKTAVLGMLAAANPNKPIRVVFLTFATLKEQAVRELRTWSGLRVAALYGRSGNDLPSGVQVIVANYEIVTARRQMLQKFLAESPTSLLICDECQRLVNPEAKITQTVLTDPDALFYAAGHYAGASATPFPNWLADAAPHFHAMAHSETLDVLDVFKKPPEVYAVREKFATFQKMKRGRRIVGNKRPGDFQRLLDQVAVKVSPEEVAEQLPDVIHRRFALGDDAILTAATKAENALSRFGIVADRFDLDLLERTKDHELHVARRAVGLLKAQAYVDLAKAEVEAGDKRPRVAFYFHVAVGELMQAELGWPRIGGDVGQDKRAEALRQFKAGEVPGLLLQLQSAGTGLDLPEGEIADFVELPWSVAAFYQATRRIARLSSEHPHVLIRTLFIPSTIDERVSKLLTAKAKGLRSVGLEADHVSAL